MITLVEGREVCVSDSKDNGVPTYLRTREMGEVERGGVGDVMSYGTDLGKSQYEGLVKIDKFYYFNGFNPGKFFGKDTRRNNKRPQKKFQRSLQGCLSLPDKRKVFSL